MGFTLGDIDDELRFASSAFTRHAVSARALAQALTKYQRRLALKLTAILPDALSQTLSIVFDLSAGNAPGVAGAGTPGGLPVEGLEVINQSIGNAVDFDNEDAQILYGPAAVTSATATSLTKAAAGWVVNAYIGKVVRVLEGPGKPAEQAIGTNTATVLNGLNWTELPTIATVFSITEPQPSTSDEVGVVTGLPALEEQAGYLVRLDANGSPFIDFTKPLIARIDRGLLLPPFTRIQGATLRFTGDKRFTQQFPIVPYGTHHRYARCAAYLKGHRLFLIGQSTDYTGCESLQVDYIPIPPSLTESRDSAFLLDDNARTPVSDYATVWAANLPGITEKVQAQVPQWGADWKDSESEYLRAAGRQRNTMVKASTPRR